MKNLRHQNEVQHFVLSCIDFRFRPLVADWIDTELQGEADSVAVPGAAKALLEPSSNAMILEYIAIAVRLHNVAHVHILSHIDCGAYGGSRRFKHQDDEIAFHQEQLQKAKSLVKSHFPHIECSVHILGFNGIQCVTQNTSPSFLPLSRGQ